MKYSLFIFLLTFISCASSTPQFNRLVKNYKSKNLPYKVQIKSVPFILQKENFCGPATLTMAMQWAQADVNIDKISKHSFIDKAHGTFQIDMLSAARREGLLAIPIRNMDRLFRELAAGNPVIVFENLAFNWYPQWHYAIIHGYDMNRNEILMHSGAQENKWWDIQKFERSWKLGNYWGLVILPSSRLSATASEVDHIRAAAALEQIGNNESAREIYQSILAKWPKSYMANIGLGNIAFMRKQFTKARDYFQKAVEYKPDFEIGQHNLSITYKKLAED